MAEVAILRAILQAPLEKASSLAAEEFSLLWGFKKHLGNLQTSLQMVQGFLHDIQGRREVNSEAIKVWLQKLEDVAYDADNVLDDVNYEILRRKIEIRDQLRRKSVASPVLGNFLLQSKAKNGKRCIKIPGVPYEAVYIFIFFLYSSWHADGLNLVVSIFIYLLFMTIT